MSLSLDELASWSVSELVSGIKVNLNSGNRFEIVSCPGYYSAVVYDPQDKVVLEETGPDQRLVLLNLFGNILSASKVVPEGSPWCRHRELPKVVAPIITGPSANDLADLDPDEISQIYKGLNSNASKIRI